jgi:nitroimidazol reductase NimA-like FMN-containing flavoprotein (pyridoxamine 5'-phosphate oxidase superfamily)
MELDRHQCLLLLAAATDGHIGLNLNALPAVFPVRFHLEIDEVVFRVEPHSKVADAIAGNVVCVQTDGDDWSVSVTGQALIDGSVVRVAAEVVTGERYSAASLAQ